MLLKIKKTIPLAFLTISGLAHAGTTLPVISPEVQHAIRNLDIKNVISTQTYQANNQNYYLILSKNKTFNKGKSPEENLDNIAISMKFVSVVPHSNPIILWSMSDNVSCPGLDISADFIPQSITFNAITPHTGTPDNVEVTVGYKMFCGGGVDPKKLKLLYHDNTQKYALRGETEIVFSQDKNHGTGGAYKMDAQFQKAPIQIQTFMKSLWDKIKTEKY